MNIIIFIYLFNLFIAIKKFDYFEYLCKIVVRVNKYFKYNKNLT